MLWHWCVWTVLPLLCLSHSPPTPCTLLHCIIYAHFQVCSSICFGILRNIVPNQFLEAVFELISLQTNIFVKSTTRNLLFREALLLVKFLFLCPTYTGTAILSCTKQYYSSKNDQPYQFIFLSNENMLMILYIMALFILKHNWNTNSCKEKVWLLFGFSFATIWNSLLFTFI